MSRYTGWGSGLNCLRVSGSFRSPSFVLVFLLIEGPQTYDTVAHHRPLFTGRPRSGRRLMDSTTPPSSCRQVFQQSHGTSAESDPESHSSGQRARFLSNDPFDRPDHPETSRNLAAAGEKDSN